MNHNALLYVFYGTPLTCASRLEVYRQLNPGMQIYGICTAGIRQVKRFKIVESKLDDLWYLPDHDGKWCWNNLDMVVCHWFLERGINLDFERILVVDWDVLLLEPAEKWLEQVGANDVKFIDVWENVRPEENYWTTSKNSEFSEFKTKMINSYSAQFRLFQGFLFAYACSKDAFSRFAESVLEFPGYCEYRLPTLMFNAGLDLSSFRKEKTWGRFANVHGISIPLPVIQQEMAKSQGFRMFHPVYEPYHNSKLDFSLLVLLKEVSWWKTVSRKGKNVIRRLQRTISSNRQ